jgi:hypothetical protein
VLRIFIALKNTSPWPELNPRTLSLVASTLPTTPPRQPYVREEQRLEVSENKEWNKYVYNEERRNKVTAILEHGLRNLYM